MSVSALAATARLRTHLRQPLFAGAYGLMASTVVTAVLGIAYWAVAARTFPAEEVGRDAVLISSMIALSSICQLNLFDGLVRFLPTVPRPRRGRAIAAAYAAALLAGVLGGAVFVLIAPEVSSELGALGDDTLLGLGFVVAVAAWGVFVLQDAALTALRRAWWLPVENAAFAVLKIVALPIAAAIGLGHATFLAWVVPLVVVLPAVNLLLARRVLGPDALVADPGGAPAERPQGRALARFLAQDYAGYVLGQVAITVVPLVVIARLGSEASAWFYMPFTLIVAFDLLFYAVTTSMTVEGAHGEQQAAELLHTVVRRFLVLLVPAVLLIVAAAPLLLAPFGSEYADEGAGALRLLACASLFRALVSLFTASARLAGRGRPILAAQATLFVLVVGLAVVLADPLGLEGVALAWLAGNAVVGIAVAPSLLRGLRAGRAA